MGNIAYLQMRRSFPCLFIFILLILSLGGCGGLSPEGPVNLPVPFSGAMDSNSRVVVVDGAPAVGEPFLKSASKAQGFASCGGKSFSAFNSNGTSAGNCFYDESRITPQTATGSQSAYTMPVCCLIDQGEFVRVEAATFFEFPFEDPSKDVCALLPAGEDCTGAKLVRGAASGVITEGTGSFASAIGLMTVEHRFAAVVKGDGQNRRFFNFIESVWLLNRKPN